MQSCEMGCIKYILFIFNLIFAISGVGIIIAGALVLSDVGDFNHFMDKQMLAPPIVLIVAGAVVFIIAFLGCFGAIRESYNLLIALMCCGVEGPGDWQGQQTLPYSCCHINEELQQPSLNSYCINAGKGKYLYQIGCYEKLTMKINDNAKVLIGVGIGIAFIEIVGIVLACWLAFTIKKGDEAK